MSTSSASATKNGNNNPAVNRSSMQRSNGSLPSSFSSSSINETPISSSSSSSAAAAAGTLSSPPNLPSPSLQGEYKNMILLLFLYFLQGIPMGLAGSVPLFLASKGASFSDQAVFSLASWPYSLKLLWAPIVDALYTTKYRLGQRKSWIIPVQLITGIIMIVLGSVIGDYFGNVPGSKESTVNIHGLLFSFFLLYFLVATQDIAVDGWALTMLRPENVGYASTANTVGQTAGFMTSFSVFMALDSADVCNTYLRRPFGIPEQTIGMVTMESFMEFWGIVFLFSTVIVWIIKNEELPPLRDANHLLSEGSSLTEEHEGILPAAAIVIAPNSITTDDEEHSKGNNVYEGKTKESRRSRLRKDSMNEQQPQLPGTTESISLSNNNSSIATNSDSSTGSVRRRSNGRKPSPNVSSKAVSTKENDKDTENVSSMVHETEDEHHTLLTHNTTNLSTASSPYPTTANASTESAWTSILTTYKNFYKILQLRPVLTLVFIMVTIKAGFQATDRATMLIAQGRGIPKETLALIDTISSPFQLMIPLALANITAGNKSFSLLITAFPVRVFFGLVYLFLLYVIIPDQHKDPWHAGNVPWYVLILFFIISNLHAIFTTAMFMGQISFFTQVAAPNAAAVGGTYITLLNTVSNLGSMWPGPITLRAIDTLTQATCEYTAHNVDHPEIMNPVWNSTIVEEAASLSCKTMDSKQSCIALGGVCSTVQDGYILMVIIGTIYSIIWLISLRKTVFSLQELPKEAWKVKL